MSGIPIQESAASALSNGALVVVPTDTVYGIAARPDLPAAVDAVFELKGRVRDKALPVLADATESLETIVRLDERALLLARRYWPGPLTLVLPRAPGFGHDLGAGGSDSVAVRVPDVEVTRSLLARSGPLAVTSANPSGSRPAITVDEARAMFGAGVAVYVDGGPSPGGRASTVVSMVGEPTVLRAGPIDEDEIRQTLTS